MGEFLIQASFYGESDGIVVLVPSIETYLYMKGGMKVV